MTVRQWTVSILTGFLLVAMTALVTLYASGYRIDLANRSLQGTGIIVVSSTPDGALVYLNGVPEDATNTSITGLKPGQYQLRLEKQGFVAWQNKVEVKKELVTQEEALLVPLFPGLEPLTFTGVQKPLLSPNRQKVIYTTNDNETNGIWLLDIVERTFNLTNKPSLLLRNTPKLKYSSADLLWAPDGNAFLVREHGRPAVLYDLATNKLEDVNDLEELLNNWADSKKKSRDKLLENLDSKIVDRIRQLPDPVWSPDNTKLLYRKKLDQGVEYRIFDLKPDLVEVGRVLKPADYLTLTAPVDKFIQVQWFSDSRHLVVLEKNNQGEESGSLSLIEIGGTNRMHVFSGKLKDNVVYPSPNGSKLIVLTNFNPESQQYNLYAISLR